MSRIQGLIGAAAFGFFSLMSAAPGAADEAARATTVRNFEAGTLAAGDAALLATLERDPGNADARLGLGMIRFVAAVEHLSQGLYRFGLESPTDVMLPIVRLPVPLNPDPVPVTYDAFRGLLIDFVADLARAETTLATVGDADAKVPVDLMKIAYDADGDGVAGEFERFGSVLAAIGGGPVSRALDSTVAFDTADAIWLRGYAHILMGFSEFMLAHDWREAFDASFHLFFPSAGLPMAQALAAPTEDPYGFDPASIADAITFIHLIDWPVAEPARMLAVRDHLKQAVALSRADWDAILAETDDDREWLPGPSQHSALVIMRVTSEQVKSWRLVLDEFDAILDGEKLIPHWRFAEGVNLRRVFEQPTPFDLVLWITGPAALPYLEDGPISSDADWQTLTRAFGPGFGAYAVWFN